MVLESTKRSQEEELIEFQKQQEVLRSKYNELKANMDGRVPAEEHVAMVNELKRYGFPPYVMSSNVAIIIHLLMHQVVQQHKGDQRLKMVLL